MSANLWTAKTNIPPNADGVYTVGKETPELQSRTDDQVALKDNQHVHIGASLRGANSGVLMPFVGYKDAVGNLNWSGFPKWEPTEDWRRFEDVCIVPSGMTIDYIGFNNSAVTGDIEILNPVFSYGDSGPVYAIASSTLAWSAGIVATTRYYQLAAPTAAAPTVPASSSSLGSWSETEPAADVTKVLWTCECTHYTDGTESWSKASKSTSYEAAKDAKDAATGAADAAKAAQGTADGAQKAADGAKSAASAAQSTADAAKGTADNLATLIHEGSDGITVGKSTDGTTFSGTHTRVGTSSFDVLDANGSCLAKFGEAIGLGVKVDSSGLESSALYVQSKNQKYGTRTYNESVLSSKDMLSLFNQSATDSSIQQVVSLGGANGDVTAIAVGKSGAGQAVLSPSGLSLGGGTSIRGVWCGSTVKNVRGTEFQLLSATEFSAITGTSLTQDTTYVGLMSGDDNAMRANITASVQVTNGKPNAVICTSSKALAGGYHRFNYVIVQWS